MSHIYESLLMIHDKYCMKRVYKVMEHESVPLFGPFQHKKLNQLLEKIQFDQNSMKPSQIQF